MPYRNDLDNPDGFLACDLSREFQTVEPIYKFPLKLLRAIPSNNDTAQHRKSFIVYLFHDYLLTPLKVFQYFKMTMTCVQLLN